MCQTEKVGRSSFSANNALGYHINGFLPQPPTTITKEEPPISYPGPNMASSNIANYYSTTAQSAIISTAVPTSTLPSLSTTNIMQGIHNGTSLASNVGPAYRSQMALDSTTIPKLASATSVPLTSMSTSLHSSQMFNAEIQTLYAEIEKSRYGF